MKKIIFALVVLLMAVPAFASVDITLSQNGNDIIVSMNNTEASKVRAIALDVILETADVCVAEVNCVNTGYTIYPGSIQISSEGEITDDGSCGCDSSYPGTLGGLEANGVSLEMGSLYVGAANAPPQGSQVVAILTLEGCDADFGISVAENAIRGGIVMEDPDEVVTVNLTGLSGVAIDNVCPTGCACWGDISGPAGVPDNLVSTSDLGLLLGTLGPVGSPYVICPVPAGLECMDISGPTGVPDGCLSTSDLGALLSYLGPIGSPYIAPCMPAP